MRSRVTVAVLVFVLMVSVAGFADTFKEILPGIGSPSEFGVFPADSKISIVNGVLNVTLKFNFPNSIFAPILDTAANPDITWFAGDLLFYVGSNKYGIPLMDHGFTVLGNPPPLMPGVEAFKVYGTNLFLTANQLLSGTDVSHRVGDSVVWLGGMPSLLGGPLTHAVTGGNASPFIVTISGQLPTFFANDVAQHGFTAYFASTECANGYMMSVPDPVPEPASLLMLGSGLLGIGALRHRIGKK